MQRSDFDFDVISGPSLPPLIRPLPTPPAPQPPRAEEPSLDQSADRAESSRQ
ncbi:hypothetical protein JYK14_11435 [Siccirubricoccus sp. KC 17139]|uniref:Uncharacterized protein n=1 Tax=Siccirubricoccus soli TaxID=2899147 RepID=A0ABT1D4B3_9PROT|nr:hypothetical protein [Siccirubricoccus soli]MCO6416766.1 hypothetical protein [Siccirubricoccus soli]MCP2682901.1 hypothetical protein [Siccirubricoccus soli]